MLTIRKATIEDLPQLTELFDQYRMFYHKTSDIEAATEFLSERILKNDSEIIVIIENETMTGFTQLYPLFSSTRMKKYWLLNDLFVNENQRGKGYSKQLLKAAQEVCQSTDACGILLETGKENIIGNSLYPNCGFKIYDDVNFYEWTHS